MRLAFREKPVDLLAVAVVGLALVPLALLAVTGAARIVLGLLFVLFLPGYALVDALFPKDGEIDWIERIRSPPQEPYSGASGSPPKTGVPFVLMNGMSKAK